MDFKLICVQCPAMHKDTSHQTRLLEPIQPCLEQLQDGLSADSLGDPCQGLTTLK